jgi:hypothetical protein
MEQLIVVLVVGALALVKWLVENSGKFQSGDDSGDETSPMDRPSRSPRPARTFGNPADASPRAESDEEKMRRFMEALGLPPNSVPPPVQRQAPRQGVQTVAPSMQRPMSRRIEHPTTSRPVASAPGELKPELARRSIAAPLDTGGPIPQLAKSRPMSESAPAVQVTSFAPAAISQTQAAVAAAGVSVTPETRGSAPSLSRPAPATDLWAGLREQLGDAAALRRAILLREILGEPKGLQSAESPSIFSPL